MEEGSGAAPSKHLAAPGLPGIICLLVPHVAAHVVAEAKLITWLAGTQRGPAPGLAGYVGTVSIAGFSSVIIGFIINAWISMGQETSERKRLEELVRRQWAAQATRPPVAQVPPDPGPGASSGPSSNDLA
ncbi:hypothetical protein RCR19_39315 [Streptomyces sp. WAC07094]|uniref:hypothetical protein n=1 Tax=Streptomyces sp. WAC07094 TaxID=3072183 RepID=UPI002EBC232A|nr:hypothetical protein [Streptomyces sp. WAC07094]